MKVMLKIMCVACFAALCGPAVSMADSSVEVAGAISAWSPNQVTEQGPRMTIVLDESLVTDMIYQSVITDGVCGLLWLKQAGSGYLEGIAEIAVVNRTQKQGFILEGGRAECDRLGALPGTTMKIELAGVTHSLSSGGLEAAPASN